MIYIETEPGIFTDSNGTEYYNIRGRIFNRLEDDDREEERIANGIIGV